MKKIVTILGLITISIGVVFATQDEAVDGVEINTSNVNIPRKAVDTTGKPKIMPAPRNSGQSQITSPRVSSTTMPAVAKEYRDARIALQKEFEVKMKVLRDEFHAKIKALNTKYKVLGNLDTTMPQIPPFPDESNRLGNNQMESQRIMIASGSPRMMDQTGTTSAPRLQEDNGGDKTKQQEDKPRQQPTPMPQPRASILKFLQSFLPFGSAFAER